MTSPGRAPASETPRASRWSRESPCRERTPAHLLPNVTHLAQNCRVIEESTRSGDLGPPAVGPAVVPALVTDDDRHQYGLLLDRAAERGLLTPYDYELRLGDLAAADTIDEMKRIVSELPVFTGISRPPGPARQSIIPLAPHRPLTTKPARRSINRWVMLAVVLVVVVAALVFLTVYAKHVANTLGNPGATPATGVAGPTPRL